LNEVFHTFTVQQDSQFHRCIFNNAFISDLYDQHHCIRLQGDPVSAIRPHVAHHSLNHNRRDRIHLGSRYWWGIVHRLWKNRPSLSLCSEQKNIYVSHRIARLITEYFSGLHFCEKRKNSLDEIQAMVQSNYFLHYFHWWDPMNSNNLPKTILVLWILFTPLLINTFRGVKKYNHILLW